MHQDKLESIRQWSGDPCGAPQDGVELVGSPLYYERVERERYEEYAPWMKQVFPFGDCAGKRILEVGCGLGTDLRQFARGGAVCTGVDLTPTHLSLTQQGCRQSGLTVRVARGDGEQLPFRDDSFDAAYSFGVIHHTPDTQAAVDEIRRVLRPGGSAWITLYHRNSAYFWCQLLGRRGLLGAELVRRGWRGLLSQIEHRVNSDARPLVKVYSRRQLRRLFGDFHAVEISCHHLEREHFSAIGHALTPRLVRTLEPQLGWYLVVKAQK